MSNPLPLPEVRTKEVTWSRRWPATWTAPGTASTATAPANTARPRVS